MGLRFEKIKQFYLGEALGARVILYCKYPKTALKDKIDILIMLHLIFFTKMLVQLCFLVVLFLNFSLECCAEQPSTLSLSALTCVYIEF